MGMMAAPLQDAPISAGDILIWARVEQALAGKNAALAAQINARACGRSMSPTADVEIASELARMEEGQLVRLWLGADDPEHPTRREMLALDRLALISARRSSASISRRVGCSGSSAPSHSLTSCPSSIRASSDAISTSAVGLMLRPHARALICAARAAFLPARACSTLAQIRISPALIGASCSGAAIIPITIRP